MVKTVRRATAVVFGALCALATPARADGLWGLSTPEPGGDPAGLGEATPATAAVVTGIPGFDPVRDVPAMENWIPDANVDGAAHCYAISMLTTYFHRRARFRAEEGTPISKTRSFASLSSEPLTQDPEGIQLAFEYLATKSGGRILIGGSPDLRAYTAPGGPGEEMFRRFAEGTQFLLQIPSMGLSYVRSILFASFEKQRRDRETPEALNRRAFERLRARVRGGELAPFTIHPSKAATEGHVIVGYETEVRGDEARLVCYDSNYPPVGARARPTTVVFDLEAGTFHVENYRGTRVHTSYDLLTTIDPESTFTRLMASRMIRHLDRYLRLTDRFYATLEHVTGEERVERWDQWKDDFVTRWRGIKDRLDERTTRRFRWRMRYHRGF